jgi:hypothetical protein
MADGRPSLGDAIRAAVPPAPVRSKSWWHALPPDVMAELHDVRADWKAGRLPGSKQALATAIRAELSARGLSDIGIQGITSWLGQD